MRAARKYTEEEQHAALELAVAVGRRAAIRELGISAATFQKWTEKHAKLWSDLRANDPEAQKRGFAGRLEDVAENALAVEHEAIERAAALLPGATPKDLASLLKALSGSRATATIGAKATRGEAETVEHNINFPALEQAMERLLGAPADQPALQVPNEAEAHAVE